MPGRLLPRQFYARDALDVARDLLGQEIWHGRVGLRITEVEAYRYPDDTANHSRAGLTARNAAMWGPPGRAYVYLCYGLHQLLNLVTNREGEAAAVLQPGVTLRDAHAVAADSLERAGGLRLARQQRARNVDRHRVVAVVPQQVEGQRAAAKQVVADHEAPDEVVGAQQVERAGHRLAVEIAGLVHARLERGDALIDGDRRLDWRTLEDRVARSAGWLEAQVALLDREARRLVCQSLILIQAALTPPMFDHDPARGKTPLSWAFNPNLCERFPGAAAKRKRCLERLTIGRAM